MMPFNIQQALTDMEERIREDIKTNAALARADAAAARIVADEAKASTMELEGRVVNLEEKAGWIAAGFGGTVIAGVGFIWHVLTSHHS